MCSYLVDRVAGVAYGQVYSEVHKVDSDDVAFVVGGVLVVELLVPFGVGPLVVAALVDVAEQLHVAPCDAVVRLLAVELLAAGLLVLFVAVASVVDVVFVLVFLCVGLALTETKNTFKNTFKKTFKLFPI